MFDFQETIDTADKYSKDGNVALATFHYWLIGYAYQDEDFSRIAAFITRIAKTGALERYFRPEGKMNDSVVALPVTSSKLRLYCLRLSDKILVLGNGGVKKSQRYEDDSLLNGYVMTLQKFEKLLRQEVANGNVNITESTIETDNIFEL